MSWRRAAACWRATIFPESVTEEDISQIFFTSSYTSTESRPRYFEARNGGNSRAEQDEQHPSNRIAPSPPRQQTLNNLPSFLQPPSYIPLPAWNEAEGH